MYGPEGQYPLSLPFVVIVLTSPLAVALVSPVAVVLVLVQVASTQFPCCGHWAVCRWVGSLFGPAPFVD
jgi:hypothetical protein